MRIIMDYSWPGNVRELENAIEHAFVLCTERHIDIFDLPIEIRQVEYHLASQNLSPANGVYPSFGQELNRERLLDLLQACDWNKAEVSRRVGLSRTSIWKYMKKWDIPLSL
jgi:two-component system response regulator HydG